jgi:hypothetical protein
MSNDDDAGELVVVGVARLEEDDFVRAYREVPALRRTLRLPLVGAVALAIVMAAYAFTLAPASRGSFLAFSALLALFASVGVWWRFARLPRSQWRALAEWQRQTRYEVRRHRIRSRTEKSANDIAYEELFGWIETPHAFYLEQAPARFIVLPKRAFESSAELEAARGVFAAAIRARPHPAGRRALYTFLLWLLLVSVFVAFFQLTRGR